jgi:hypothetical protein
MTPPYDADGALADEVFGTPPVNLAFGEPVSTTTAPPPPPAPEPEEERLPEFDPRYRDEFEGLLYLGCLRREVSFWGHKFLLVTPSTAERLEIALLTKPYQETVGFDFAYAAALVAAYLVEVDGRPLPRPFTNEAKDTALQHRWTHVRDNFMKPVIDQLYEECYILDGLVREILDAMGKA